MINGYSIFLRKWVAVFFAISFAALSLGVDADVGESNHWTVATYNVRNYLSQDRLVRGKWRKDYPKPEEEKSIVRASILRMRPDVLALQEIGSEGHLRELQADLAKEGLKYTHRAFLEAGDPTRHVAVLWKLKNGYRVREHDDLTVNYFGNREPVKRGALEIEFRDDSGAFSLFVLHLKSKYTNRQDDPLSAKRRVLEARAIRDRILERYPNPSEARFLVLGDFNDTPDSAPIRAFANKGKLPICSLIPAFDTQGAIWTHFYKKGGLYSKVDYIMRSVGWQSLAEAEGAILSRVDFYEGSDHRLVTLSLPLE